MVEALAKARCPNVIQPAFAHSHPPRPNPPRHPRHRLYFNYLRNSPVATPFVC